MNEQGLSRAGYMLGSFIKKKGEHTRNKRTVYVWNVIASPLMDNPVYIKSLLNKLHEDLLRELPMKVSNLFATEVSS